MRTRKRLQYVREDANGTVFYRAKRKREMALIAPSPAGGYDLVYVKDKIKRTATAMRLQEAKDACEAMRSAPPRRNPLPSWVGGKAFWWGAGVGAAIAATAAILMEKNASAQVPKTPALPGAGGSSGASSGASPSATSSPASSNPATVAPLAADEDTQELTWNGGPLALSLPLNVGTSWVSVNGSTSGVNATGPLYLPANPVGTWTIVYNTADGPVTTTVTITALPGASV